MLSETVAKTSAGALENILISRVTNLSQIIDKLKEQNIWIYGTDLKGQNIYKGKVSGAIALVLGNESKGVSPNILKK
jgi:23S rRNA (guanosine2251-2'-O)-methyltransferase